MNMKRLLSLVAFFATLQASAQQVNPVPDYVFRNQMSVGRGTVTDTAAYFSIGPRYGANKGFMPPIVGDTATFSSGKRNGLLIFSVQKNKFLYWDSVRVQWSDMAGSSGTYITGTGITGYLPQFNGTTTIDTSALFTLGRRLGIGSSTFAYTSTNSANVELNGTAGGILGFKRNDSARGYLWHTGDNMELANTTAGAISFNTNSATRGSISSAGVWRLHNLAGTGDRVVVASSNGTLSASTSVTGLVDTTTISTRAWRQKGDDSLGAIIATKGSGTVTSVATGYGLSGGTITTTGTLLVDTLNIATRAWRQKGLDSLAALEVSGSGTTNYVPKFTAASTIGNSQIFDNGTNVGIGTASPGVKLDVVGSAGTIVRTKGGTGSAQGSAYYVQLAGSTSTLSAFGDRANIFGGTVDQIASIYTGSSIPLTFDVNTAERMRITSGGDVGIGGTPLDKFTIFQDQNATSTARVRNTDVGSSAYAQFVVNASGNSWGFRMGSSAANSNALDIVSDAVGTPASRLRIFANGRIGVNTTTDAGYQFDVNGTLRSVNGANFATTSGNVGIGTASPTSKLDVVENAVAINQLRVGQDATHKVLIGAETNYAEVQAIRVGVDFNKQLILQRQGGEVLIATTTDAGDYKLQVAGNIYASGTAPSMFIDGSTQSTLYFSTTNTALYNTDSDIGLVFFVNGANQAKISTAGELLLNSTGTDAGDYKLQVSGNALVTAGKLDITTNTAFGLSVSRSGTSVVGGQINNSNGILYYGAESSTGGGLFTGSSAYAAVIGSGANYPLQFATNNVTRATIDNAGALLIGATTAYNVANKMEVYGPMMIRNSPTSGTLNLDSTALSANNITNRTAFQVTSFNLTGSGGNAIFYASGTWNTTAATNAIDVTLTNTASGAGSNYLRITDGVNQFRVTKEAEVVTAAPTGGSIRKWKLGEAATVSPTSPNRTIRVEIDGTVYYLHAKTTND